MDKKRAIQWFYWFNLVLLLLIWGIYLIRTFSGL